MDTKFINAQNVKNLAKEYGEQQRGQETRIGSDFMEGINTLVEQVVLAAVRTQEDDTRMTLQSTEWLERQIATGIARTQEAE